MKNTADKIQEWARAQEQETATKMGLTPYVNGLWINNETKDLYSLTARPNGTRVEEVDLVQDYTDLGKMYYKIVRVKR